MAIMSRGSKRAFRLKFGQSVASWPPEALQNASSRRNLYCDIRQISAGIMSPRDNMVRLELDGFMQVSVRDNNVDQALRALKKKLQREGVYREMKLRRHYEKPSEKRARERAAAIRRARKLERKRMERDGI
jgi:small subunit ribosomal protein S21